MTLLATSGAVEEFSTEFRTSNCIISVLSQRPQSVVIDDDDDEDDDERRSEVEADVWDML